MMLNLEAPAPQGLQSTTTQVAMNVGDFVEARAAQNSGGNLSSDAGTARGTAVRARRDALCEGAVARTRG
jgi:hypothetical protein